FWIGLGGGGDGGLHPVPYLRGLGEIEPSSWRSEFDPESAVRRWNGFGGDPIAEADLRESAAVGGASWVDHDAGDLARGTFRRLDPRGVLRLDGARRIVYRSFDLGRRSVQGDRGGQTPGQGNGRGSAAVPSEAGGFLGGHQGPRERARRQGASAQDSRG